MASVTFRIGALSDDERERAVQLGLAPESGPIDVEIEQRARDALLKVRTLRAMRWLESRFNFLPVPARMHRAVTFRVPLDQVERALAELRAAGLIAVSLQ